jgi:hypothetical protein
MSKSPWQPRDIAWAEWQAAHLNTTYQRYGITSQCGPITSEMVLHTEQSYCASSGISLDEFWAAREAKRPAARVAAMFRESVTGLSGHITTELVTPPTSERGAVATVPETGGESPEAEIPPEDCHHAR